MELHKDEGFGVFGEISLPKQEAKKLMQRKAVCGNNQFKVKYVNIWRRHNKMRLQK